MACGSCGPKTLTVEQMKNMTSEQIIAAYRAGYKLVQGGAPAPEQQAMSQSQDWQYGGVRSLVGSSCDAAVKPVGKGITMSANPQQGVSPYTISFRRSNAGDTTNDMTTGNVGATTYEIPSARLGTALTGSGPYPATPDALVGGGQPNPVTGYTAEGTAIVYTYVLTTTDINDATSRVGGESASLLFGALITDSCSPAQTCVNYCKVIVACPTPVCDFTVA